MPEPQRALVIMRKKTGALTLETPFETEIPQGAIVIVRESSIWPPEDVDPAQSSRDIGED